MIKCRVTCIKEYSPNCFPRLIKGIISPVFKSCTWTIWIIISTLKISLCLSDITSAAHAVQIHSIVRKFAFDPLLKLMEGNLHYTGKVAGFCHHIGIVKEHQLFGPPIAGKVISRIWVETMTPNIQWSIKEKFHTLCQSFHSFNEVQTYLYSVHHSFI